jgi:hypothetical protein
VDLRSKTNAVLLLDMGNTLRGEHIHKKYRRIENRKLESVLCVHCRGVNIVTLQQQRSLWEGDLEVVKRSDRDESVRVAIHMCMEAMIGISWYSYIYLKLPKTLCLSYYCLCLLFNKVGEKSRTGSAWKQGGCGRGRWWRDNVGTYE